MFFRDVFKIIKSSLNRFLAMAGIVFIGAAFMMGLLTSSDVMRENVEKYNNDYKLHDVQIYSSFGFDDEDLRDLKSLTYVDELYPSKTRDVFFKSENDVIYVTRVRELESNLDKFVLKEGRLPKNDDECIVICPVEYETCPNLNDVIDLYLEKEELSESLKNTKFKIVGIVYSPDFISKVPSTSNLDNLELVSYTLVPNNNFIGEYYTSISLTIKGAREYNSFTDDYEKFVEDKVKDLNKFADKNESRLKDKIVFKAQDKIDEAKKELEKAKRDGQKELDDAYQKLLDAKNLIESSESQIIDGENKLIAGEKEYEENLKKLKENEISVNAAINDVETSASMSIDDLFSKTQEALNTYNYLIDTKELLTDGISKAESGINDARKIGIFNKTGCDIARNAAYLLARITGDYSTYDSLNELYSAFEFLETAYDNLSELNDGIKQIEDAYSSSGGVDKTYNDLASLLDARDQIQDGYSQLANAKKEIDDNKVKLENAKVELENGKIEYEEGLAEYNDGLKKFKREISNAEDEIEDAEDKIKDLADARWEVLDRTTHFSSLLYKNSIDQMHSLGVVLPFMFFLVAALVCSTTMKRLIDEQRGLIGIYSGIGYSKLSIALRYLCYVIAASLFSAIIACFVGVFVFSLIVYNTWRILFDILDPKLIFPIKNIAISTLSFVFIMSFVSMIVISRTLKECPAQLMRPKAPKISKEIMLEKFKWLWNKLSFTSKITARNIFRYKSRFIMTIVGVAGCTGIILLGFGIKDSIGDVIDAQYGKIINFDYSIGLSNDRHIDEIIEEISKDKNNHGYSLISQYSTRASKKKDDKGNVAQLNVGSVKDINYTYSLFDSNSKELVLNNNGVIVTKKFAENNNIKVGDQIYIESTDGKKAPCKVTGIATMYYNHYIYITRDLYNTLFPENDLKITNINIKSNSDIKTIKQEVLEFNDVTSVMDSSHSKATFETMIVALDYIIVIVIITAGCLAFVVLVNLINVNISERIREIATLKVLGFRNIEVDRYIFKEIMLLTLIGDLLGLPLGVLEAKYVLTVIDMDFVMFPFNVKLNSFIYSYLITLSFTIIVFLITNKTLKKIDMIESLKSVE